MIDVHTLAGPYALDALDDDERHLMEAHLAECESCRLEVASYRETAGALAELADVAPPARLRESVLAGVATIRPLPPVEPERRRTEDEAVTPITAARRRRTVPSFLLVAAAVVLIALASVLVVRPWSGTDTQPSLTATEQVLQDKDAVRVPAKLDDGATATMVYSEQHDQVVLLTEGLETPPGQVIEAWFQVPGQGMVRAGLLPSDETDTSVLLHGDPSDATAVGLTVEPEGGSDTPTSEPIAVMELDQA